MSMTDAIKNLFLEQPDMIGSIPGLKDQGTLAFHIWISHFRPVVLADPAIQADPVEFARRMLTLKRDEASWRAFVEQWRMTRILFDNDFGVVFKAVKEGLRIQEPASGQEVAPPPPPASENRAEREQRREDEKKDEL